MNSVFLVLLSVFSMILSSFEVRAQSSGSTRAQTRENSAKQAVREREQAWLDGLFRLDKTKLEQDEAEEFTLITPMAMILGRQEHLSAIQKQKSHGGLPAASSLAFALSDQTIKIDGDVAIVLDICNVSDDGGSSGVTGGRYWQTEVWKKQANQWKLLHVHMSMMKSATH